MKQLLDMSRLELEQLYKDLAEQASRCTRRSREEFLLYKMDRVEARIEQLERLEEGGT